jgi:hypothetical protein
MAPERLRSAAPRGWAVWSREELARAGWVEVGWVMPASFSVQDRAAAEFVAQAVRGPEPGVVIFDELLSFEVDLTSSMLRWSQPDADPIADMQHAARVASGESLARYERELYAALSVPEALVASYRDQVRRVVRDVGPGYQREPETLDERIEWLTGDGWERREDAYRYAYRGVGENRAHP